MRIECLIVRLAAVATLVAVFAPLTAAAQNVPAQTASQPQATLALPEPIYWKQTFFQIPYQWSSAAEPGAAQLVWLLVSKDRGTTWQKISEANPSVTSFNYRAEGDGEYWFAVRTIDRQGRAWPAGDYQPELRVIVDTTIPRIEQLHATLRGTGEVELAWSAYDANLHPGAWVFEAQSEPNGAWLPMTLNPAAGAAAVPSLSADGYSRGRATWRLPAASPPIAVRATVSDRAGNSATFHSEVRPATGGSGIVTRLPAPPPTSLATDQPTLNPFVGTIAGSPSQTSATPPATASGQGWVSGTQATSSAAPPTQPDDQLWSAGTTAHTPFRLWSSGVPAHSDSATSYGTPAGAVSLHAGDNQARATSQNDGVSAQYAVASPSSSSQNSTHTPSRAATPPFQPLQPYRQASPMMPPAAEPYVSRPSSDAETIRYAATPSGLPPTNAYTQQQFHGEQPKLVGSRTFALEYDLEDMGRWGVSKVELWGTRDGGQSWRRYTQDDDQRSPLIVTVDEEGLYGFRIVVQTAGSVAAGPPQPGDAPELYVAVDLQQPVAELTAIERGTGNLVDHLILYWRAEDDNLAARPISLYYSSRPNGPWSTVAANLENTGHYAWRIDRHVPERFYLRLEVHDTAGNMAAFHTREPIAFAAPAPSLQLNSAESAGAVDNGADASYR